MGKFCQFLTLSAQDMSIFSFPNDNLSKSRGIFTKLVICIDTCIVKIWLWIGDGQI